MLRTYWHNIRFWWHNNIYIRYTENRKSIFGENIHWLVGKIPPPDFGQILRFSNGKVANSTLMNSFYKLIIWIKSKFRGPEVYGIGKKQALTGAEIWKMWKSHPGLFSAEIFKYVRRKGGSKSGFWGQNPKIWNSLGPKWISMGSPCLFKLSWGPGGPMGGPILG